MKKTIYSVLFAAGILMAGSSCSDYLETNTTSKADASLVFSTNETARAALEGAYTSWTDAGQNKVFGDGLFYAADVAGSDIERHPENFSNQPGRHYPECFYHDGKYAGEYTLLSYQKENDTYASLYAVITKASIVASSIEGASNFQEMLNAGVESTMGQLYGEAIALRATAYRELIKYFGDVPYISGKLTDHDGLVGRDSIYDVILAELQQAAPVMYRVGSIPGVTGKNYFSRTYVEGLIGRMALEAGGYQTRRGDIKRVDGQGNELSFENFPGSTENNGATYARRIDWKKYYQLAQKYFKAVIDNPGSAKFITTDSRAVPNPYQVFFQQMHMEDETYADESIYAGGASVAWVTYKDVTVSGGVSNLANTVVHEAVGHGLGKLADEYAYLAQGGVTENAAAYIRKVQKWNWYLNISLSASSSEVPWSRFVGDDAFASEKIGAYAGGDTFWSGVWRPTEQSVMNDSNNYGSFNAPSRSQIWTRVMKLSEGESWTYDYNAFKAWDKAHPAANTAKRVVKAGEKTHSHVPPVTLRKTWKEIIK